MSEIQTRQLAAIMFVDIQGFTRKMSENEELATGMRRKLVDGLLTFIPAYGGKIIKHLGDGALCLFNSDIQAVNAAIELQLLMLQEPKVPVRIGIHSGDVSIDEHDVYGDGVNVASRVESFAVAGGILLSGKVYDEIKNQPNIKTKALGKFGFKNVREPIAVYAIANEGIIVPDVRKMDGKGITYYQKNSVNVRKFALLALLIAAISIIFFKIIRKDVGRTNSIVVMPFKNLSEAKDNDFFSDGITEDILTQISKIGGLSVLSQSTTQQLKNNTKGVVELAKELGVNYVLEGSVRQSSDQIRITAQLVDANTGQNIWADTYDREYSKIFEIQGEIAKFIANVLKTKLSSSVKESLNKKPTSSLSAYEHYLRGRDHYYQFSKAENDLAINEFKTAIALDEKYSLAWAGLADAFSQKMRLGFSQGYLDSGKIAGEKAIALDTASSEAYKSLANYYLYTSSYDKAKQLLLKSIALNPNNAPAIGNLGSCYLMLGQLDEALKWQKKSAVLEPKKFVPFYIVGWIYRLMGDYQSAEQWVMKALELKPFTDTYRELAYTYLEQNKNREAKALVPKILSLDTTNADNFQLAGEIYQFSGDISGGGNYFQKAFEIDTASANNPESYTQLGIAYAMQKENKKVDAEIILSRALLVYTDQSKKASNSYDRYVYAAAAASMENNTAQSIAFLQQAVNYNWNDCFLAEKSPWFENVKEDPGFKNLVAQIKNKAQSYRSKVSSQ